MFRLMKQHGLDDLLDVDRADVSLFMTSDVERGIVYGVEQFDPDWDKRRNPLAGDFLNDVYEECIQPIHAFINDQLGVDEESGVRKARVAERQSILASLMAQVVNPNASQTIYLSLREHEIVQRFYDDLKALLESETFCAMFDDAAPFPDYPDLPEMDTIFGIGHHQRIRIRPGGREAWTVGGGLNPVRPTTFVNRYDLEKRVLLERLAPFAGTSVDENEPDTGTGVITDIAFSPDGDRVYVVAPTKNGQNTLFRAGRVGDDGVKWGELVTICDTKLLTLATTGADPGHVYAVGSMTGLYKIDPGAVDPSMAPIQVFPSSGHLVMTADGRGYATAVAQGTTGSVPTYDRISASRSGRRRRRSSTLPCRLRGATGWRWRQASDPGRATRSRTSTSRPGPAPDRGRSLPTTPVRAPSGQASPSISPTAPLRSSRSRAPAS